MSLSSRYLRSSAERLNPGAHLRTRQELVESYFARGFSYSKKLSEHASCVNALVFSRREGRWLASAGDDRSVYIWDLHQDNLTKPSLILPGHRSNVFCLAFSASNRYVLSSVFPVCYAGSLILTHPVISGGVDERINKHDLEHQQGLNGPTTWDVFSLHSDSVREISCHPSQDEVFLSASEDGSILLHDARAGSRHSQAQATLQQTAEFTGVQYHPYMEYIFATSDINRVCLRDARMAFGPLRERTREGIVQKYLTTLAKKPYEHRAQLEASSFAFDAEGSKLAVTFLNNSPTIYSISDPFPLAVCTGRNFPDGNPPPAGERSYSNVSTIKHGSFGGPEDRFYSAGSDDFRGYVWKIPATSVLEDQREILADETWASGERPDFDRRRANNKYMPVELSTPQFHLTGHKSIVNTTLIHPVLPLILTAGIERHILVHSPTPAVPFSSDLRLTPVDIRRLPAQSTAGRERYRQAILALPAGETFADDDPTTGAETQDQETIDLFDEILRREAPFDLFSSGQAPFMQAASDSEDGESEDSIDAGRLCSDESQDEDLL